MLHAFGYSKNDPSYNVQQVGREARAPMSGRSNVSKIQASSSRIGIYVLCFFDYGVHNFATIMYAAVLGLSLLCLWQAAWPLLKSFIPIWIATYAYIILSYFHVLPSAWTIFYEPEVILRQAAWVVTLPLLANLGYCYVRGVLWGRSLREFMIVTTLLLGNFLLSGIVFADWSYSEWAYGPFGYLWAPLSIYLTVAAWGVIIERQRAIVALFLIQTIVVIFWAEGSQTKLAYICFAFVFIMHRSGKLAARFALLGVIAFLVVGYAWAWIGPMDLSLRDPSAAVRGLMIKNAWQAAQETGFIGVGFGTESIKNVYPELGIWSFQTIDDAFILIGTHNAFFDILMRMGVLGLACFVFVFLDLAFPRGGTDEILTFRTLIFATSVLNLSVNVGLQSPFHLAGIAVMLGASFAAAAILPPSTLDGSHNSKRRSESHNSYGE